MDNDYCNIILKEQLKRLEGEIKRCENMLSNQNFIAKAPKEKVDLEKEKLEDYRSKYQVIQKKLK